MCYEFGQLSEDLEVNSRKEYSPAMHILQVQTGCSRYSELTVNMNNILPKVININFNMLQFTTVLKLFLNFFIFCVKHLLRGHHPPECTGAHELRSCNNASKGFS